jgi:hypothetical protein
MLEGEKEQLVYEVQKQISLIEAAAILAFVAAVNRSTQFRHPWLERAARAYVSGQDIDKPPE